MEKSKLKPGDKVKIILGNGYQSVGVVTHAYRNGHFRTLEQRGWWIDDDGVEREQQSNQRYFFRDSSEVSKLENEQ